jgi:hypothetical protein
MVLDCFKLVLIVLIVFISRILIFIYNNIKFFLVQIWICWWKSIVEGQQAFSEGLNEYLHK